MKKIKLLTPILTTACVATTIVPIASCSKIEHITLSSLEEGTQVGTKNGKYCYARYNLSLDNDTYKNGDITCKVVSDNKDLFIVNPTINGYSLTLDVQYWKLEVGEVKFTVQFSNGSWTQNIDLIMNITELEPTLDDYISRYKTIRDYFLANEQEQQYSTFDLSVGDYIEGFNGTETRRETIDASTKQENVLTYRKSEAEGKYDSTNNAVVLSELQVRRNCSMSLAPEPELLKAEYEYMISQPGVKIKWIVPDDGSLGYIMENTYEENNIITTAIGGKTINAQGYLIKYSSYLEHRDSNTGDIKSYEDVVFNMINYR